MTVRAKFYVYSVTQHTNGGAVKLQAVCRGQDNKEWAAATPSGTIDMGILNQAALDAFKPGDEFFVTFTPAPKGQEGMSGADPVA